MADGLPEDNEHYVVTLTSVDGGATLDAARATIFIRLNGDANGVVLLEPESQYLVLSENGPQSTGSGTVRYGQFPLYAWVQIFLLFCVIV